MQFVTPANIVAALFVLAPYLAIAFFAERITARVASLPLAAKLLGPASLCVPYILVSSSAGNFRWGWLALYALLPVAIAALLARAAIADPKQRSSWRELAILAVLGLAVDLRWFESAWPAHLAIFSKVLLLDAGIYGFVLVRNLDGTGFNLRLRRRDVVTGLREAALYIPIALTVGFGLGFLHVHRAWPGLMPIAGAWVFTFFFIAVPEELFFRGWIQNLLERRMGRTWASLLTAALFGLAHFNKRAAIFNWRYVLMAAIAGVFYGRAWRRDRRVGASAVTHATVDAIWSLWLR
jgi:membrane protease YdiL (CAAX protease family)